MSSTKAKSKLESSSRNATKRVTLIYCPLHLGGPHAGVSMGPAAVKVARLVSKVEAIGFTIAKEVEIAVPEELCWFEKSTGVARCVPEIAAVSQSVAEAVEEALDQGTIAVTIGGDHSLAVGSIAGAASHYRRRQEEFGLIWYDAHGDINTPSTSVSGNVHGMPLAVSLGNGDERLVNLLGFSPKVTSNRCSLIGIRDLDTAECEMISSSGILPFTMRDVDELGVMGLTKQALNFVGAGMGAGTGTGAESEAESGGKREIAGLHVSFDLDVMDPDVAPGVSTDSRGGLSYRESHHALELLADTGLVRSIDIVELNPARDICNRTAELAVDLVQSALGKNILARRALSR